MVQGGNFFKKAWNGIKKANSWLRDTKAISRISKHIPVIGPSVHKVSSVLGYGCISTPRYVKGRGWIKNTFNKVKGWNTKLKDKKYVSKFANVGSNIMRELGDITGNSNIQNAANYTNQFANTASKYGYGRGGKRLRMNGGSQMRTLQLCKMKSNMM